MSDLPVHPIIPRAEVDAAAKASFARMQALLTGRMSDAEYGRRCFVASISDNDRALVAECDRARAAEQALAARVAELAAELRAYREGLTGTPECDGVYWCEVQPKVHNWNRWESGAWRWHAGAAPIRFYRMPGETYTVAP